MAWYIPLHIHHLVRHICHCGRLPLHCTGMPSSKPNATDTSGAHTSLTQVTITPREHSEVEITGEIPVAVLERFREKTLKRLAAAADIPGFRKGHVPPSVIEGRMDAVALLKEVAEEALAAEYPALVAAHRLEVISRPAVSLTKLVPGEPVGFRIITAVMPEVTLPDYRSIAAKERKKARGSPPAATDEEVEAVITDIRRREAAAEKRAKGEAVPDHIPDANLPPLTDAMAQKLGDFRSVQELREKIRANITQEKAEAEKNERRKALMEALLAKTTVAVPRVFIESELTQMLQEVRARVARMGVSWEHYLAHMKKTEEELKKEWEGEAEKRAKIQLLLDAVARKENIAPDPEKVAQETAHILEHYRDADEHRVRTYVTTLLTNQAVLQFLEEGADKAAAAQKAAQPAEDTAQK